MPDPWSALQTVQKNLDVQSEELYKRAIQREDEKQNVASYAAALGALQKGAAPADVILETARANPRRVDAALQAMTFHKEATAFQQAQDEMAVKKALQTGDLSLAPETYREQPGFLAQFRTAQSGHRQQLLESGNKEALASYNAQAYPLEVIKKFPDYNELAADPTSSRMLTNAAKSSPDNTVTEGFYNAVLDAKRKRDEEKEKLQIERTKAGKARGTETWAPQFKFDPEYGGLVKITTSKETGETSVTPVLDRNGQPIREKMNPKQLAEAQEFTGEISKLVGLGRGFEPRYGGGAGGARVGGPTGLLILRALGTDVPQTSWWQQYQDMDILKRHALFGATLTQGEQAAWDKITVNANSDPKVIENMVATRVAIALRALDRAAQMYESTSISAKPIREEQDRLKTSFGGNYYNTLMTADITRIPNVSAKPSGGAPAGAAPSKRRFTIEKVE